MNHSGPRYPRRRLLAALLAIPLVFGFEAPAAQAQTSAPASELIDRTIVLAELDFRDGVEAIFTVDELSSDYGLVQNGEVGRNGPVATDPDSLLAAYLEVTPREVPVPRELLGEWPSGEPYPPELADRSIVPAPVRARDLAVPSGAAVATAKTCWSIHYDPYHWYEIAGYPDPTSKVHPAKTFYSSQFGGMARYSRSYLANCGSFPVAHRVYYKSFGSYYLQHSYAVPSYHWQAVKKGSVHRYRKVHYDWGVGYTRNGLFK